MYKSVEDAIERLRGLAGVYSDIAKEMRAHADYLEKTSRDNPSQQIPGIGTEYDIEKEYESEEGE